MNLKISRRNLIKSSMALAALPTLPIGFLLPNSALASHRPSGELLKNNPIGFHGKPIDPVLNLYQYGNGYRLYNPYLRRFQQFDIEMSPFGEAGTNGYLFVSNDPFNRTDPDGRLDVVGLAGGILAAIFAIASFTATILSGGLAAPTVGAALSTTTFLSGLISSSTGIAAAIIDDPSHPAYYHLSKASAWSGLIIDIASVSIGGVGVMKAGTNAMNLTASANKTLGFSTQNIAKQISKAKWISKVELGHETLDTIGTSMGLAAGYQEDKTLSKVGIGFNIGSNIGKLSFYSRVPVRMLASKVANVKSPSNKGLGRYYNKSFGEKSSNISFLGARLGNISTSQVAIGKGAKEAVRATRIIRNTVRKANMYAPTSLLETALTGPASINSRLSSEIIESGELSSDVRRHGEWQGSESSGYGYGLEHLN
ncbi:hypothetical protein K1P63_004170 [Vibrio vulnificus]|nr:hypothetical protein [Vibrio vulnificus]